MSATHINPESLPQPQGQYSMVAVAPSGRRLAFVSGQTGRQADGSLAADAEAECRDTFRHVALACEAIGATPRDIVHLRTLLVGSVAMEPFRAARRATFDAWFGDGPVPASTLAFVTGLADPEAICEIEAVVAVT